MTNNTGTNNSNTTDLPLLPLITRIKDLINTARITSAYNINILQVRTNFEIGRLIVEYEQGGSERAEYGTKTIHELSKRLTAEIGRDFLRSNLENMRRFFFRIPKNMGSDFPDTVWDIIRRYGCNRYHPPGSKRAGAK